MTIESSPGGYRCELSAAARVEQAARWDGLRSFVIRHVRTEDGVRVTFDASCQDELLALVAVERECCGWARWSSVEDGDGVVLHVTGPSSEITALADALGF